MIGYNTLRKIILDILHTKLSKNLHYHGVNHTLDALKTSGLYLKHIEISNHEAQLLRLGILFHDIGFIESNENHEYRGSEIAKKMLAEYDFAQEDIDIIVGLILSTKVPQQPKTQLERMICDIDLDYLGRPDFYKISNYLFRELAYTIGLQDKKEWDKIQIKFLEAHKYHTDFAINRRQPEKEKRIEELKQLVKF